MNMYFFPQKQTEKNSKHLEKIFMIKFLFLFSFCTSVCFPFCFHHFDGQWFANSVTVHALLQQTP